MIKFMKNCGSEVELPEAVISDHICILALVFPQACRKSLPSTTGFGGCCWRHWKCDLLFHSNMTSISNKNAKLEGAAFLEKYLGKTLRVETDDERLFSGQFKCTDRV